MCDTGKTLHAEHQQSLAGFRNGLTWDEATVVADRAREAWAELNQHRGVCPACRFAAMLNGMAPEIGSERWN